MNKTFVAAIILLGIVPVVRAADTPPASRPATAPAAFKTAVPDHPFTLLLTRPEKTSITLSVLANQDLNGSVAYGTKPGNYSTQTPAQLLKKAAPAEILLSPLQPDTTYYYQFRSAAPGEKTFTSSPEYSFHTARPPGSTFTFTMTADAHLDEHTTPEVYLRTLVNIRADHPDFHLDLGNLFMTDKHPTRDSAAAQYLAQRYYLSQFATSSPLLLALGTHDGENARYDDGTETCLASWSALTRRKLFPNPIPDDFYSGNKTPHPPCDLLQNYYSFQWGDALFVVLDPFRYSLRQRGGPAADGWAWSLGKTQYDWLSKTLADSTAKFKFVFIHNLLTADAASRGGVEIASFNEWGGENLDGTDGFKTHRPGWDLPVHQLLVKNHVTAVFKAHDNFYARQELDGILYLMVPQPSFAGNDRIRDLENYGYKQGTFLGNSGHVRVTVSPEQVKTEYVRSCLPKEESDRRKNGEVADSCTIKVGQEK